MANIIKGKVFVVGDNIDTDQIIPAQYLNLVPTIKEEYEKLGSYALVGLPDEHKIRYIAEGKMKTEYQIVVGGSNFGCGSSREHAPISLGAAGCKVVIANSFARIFFRNCIATGEVFPVEMNDQLNKELKTGDEVEVDLDNNTVKVVASGETHQSRDLGAVKEIINAGGIFNYARKSGMI
ncbi:MAG: 3-isopropylmalate dehydratase [Lentisphaerae bacterium]|nr:3-isopropylmalate dehydratase [Lentisphaerota bacterium]MCP4100587.1 3-isopropylmalate dehydratase [Lentisphaerota bacterium]